MHTRRVADFDARLRTQQQWLQQQTVLLRHHRRLNQYRYEQHYLDGLRRQQSRVASLRSYNYYGDPFFYTPVSYAYVYGGRVVKTNRYGVDALRNALNAGYEQGYRAAQADRADGWGYDYRGCPAYRDAYYGYTGLYLDPAEYNYYFREGFRRGYDDGYYRRYRYGGSIRGRLELTLPLANGILRLRLLG